MKLSLSLLESDSDIRIKILDSIRDIIDPAIKKSIPGIKNKLQQIVKTGLKSEPEYQSLINGKLKYEMGIPTQSKVDNIIDLWISNIIVAYSGLSYTNQGLKGSLSLDMIKASYDDVLGNENAVVVDGVSGVTLPWLEWLLLYGGKIIVRNYKVRFGPNNRSRTGMAIMIESTGSNWRVPPEFAGTLSNNWVTRSLDKVNNQIIDIMQKELEQSL